MSGASTGATLVAQLAAVTAVELLAAATGLLGTALLAIKAKWAGWGFVAYLVSNGAWISFALDHGHMGLLLQQAGFTAFSVVGVWQWLLKPAVDGLDGVFDWGDRS